MGLTTLKRTWLAALALCTGMCCATGALAQFSIPSNDLCSGAIPLTVNTPVIANNVSATNLRDGPPAACAATSNYRGVWYTFVPPATGLYQVSSCHSFFDTSIQVYSAVDCATFADAGFVRLPGGCNADQCGGGPGPGGTGSANGAVISNLQLTGGQTYWICLSGVSASGWYQLGVYSYGGSGACCANNGVCTVVTSAANCPAIDGTYLYMGNGTVCSPNPCVGACCNNTTNLFACTITPPGTAANQCGTGVWQGFGSTCASGTCPLGTCCTAAGACSLTLQKSCTTTSAWNGSVTSCAPNSGACNSGVGACCNNTTGSCQYGPLPCGTGTTFAGFGSTCTPSPCALGACCSTAAACTLTVAPACPGASRWNGAVTACTPSPCTFACCDTTGTGGCVLLVGVSACPTGTVSQGLTTTCTPGRCTGGACCSTAGVCSFTVSNNCAALNQFMGNGSSCSPTPCTVGACCSAAGTCTVIAQYGCTGTSIWLGAGTAGGSACNPTTLCQDPLLMGACCSTTGACTATTPAGCVGQSTFLGAGVNYTGGTTCTSTTYCTTDVGTAIIGACCSTTGACTVTTPQGCPGTSAFLGIGNGITGTACNTTSPCQIAALVGACCSGTAGGCTITTAAGCFGGLGTAGTGSFQGAGVGWLTGTACNPTTYCQTPTILGACCSTAGACTVTVPVGCVFPSVFQGVGIGYASGTTCSSTTLCQTTANLGACCSSAGACTATTAAGCLAPSVYSGAGVGYTSGTACSATTFCQTTSYLGACCSSAGVCTTTTALGCVGTSVFQGVGVGYAGGSTACNPTTFCQVNTILGGCCSSAGACTATTAANCIFPNSFQGAAAYTGGTVACTPTTFCQTTTLMGACCSSTGACTATIASGCNSPSTFQGLGVGYTTGTACTPTTFCSDVGTGTLGACCSASGGCTANTAAGCATISSNTFSGVGNGVSGTACSPTTFCTTSLGACCNTSNGTCSQTTSAGCLSPSSFTAVGTACTPSNPCGGSCCNTTTYACSTVLNAASCAGTFAANGTCAPNPCLAGLPSICQNFDAVAVGALPTDWTSTVPVGVGALWAVVSTSSNTPANSVFTNDVASASNQILTLPAVFAAGPLVLDFYSNSTTESGWDGWIVEASVNGGAFANIGDAAWSINGYTTTLNAGSANPLTGQRAFSGALDTWTERTASIPASAGDSVVIRFNMGSDGSVASTGVWLDDVCVYNIQIGSGACCANDGSCTVTASNLCSAPSIFQGIASTCGANNTCPGATSACCNNTTGVCVFTGGTSCAAGSTSQGAACSPSPCAPSAICCNTTTGVCAQIYGGACAAGTVAGTGTTCSPSPCPPVGFCCVGTACTAVIQSVCTGTWAAGSCTPNLCQGACCSFTGACTLTTDAASCTSGTFSGAGTTCTAGLCPTGACCNGATCTQLTSAGCAAQSGTFFATGSCNAGYPLPIAGTSPMEDISAIGTTMTLSGGGVDDGYQLNIPLGFTFNFYGAPQTTINIATNGVAFFGVTGYSGYPIPTAFPSATNPTNSIAPYWCDLLMGPTTPTQMTYTTLGSAPYRRFIGQWTNAPRYNAGAQTGSVTFQFILYETADAIAFRYGTLTIGTPTSATTWTGVENTGGTVGTQGVAASNTSLVFLAGANPCGTTPITGACCTGASCSASGGYPECIVAGGVYQGNNTTCTANACTVGACCNATACTLSTPAFCSGTFNGAASCTATTCNSGVCCRGSTCTTSITSAAECTASLTPGALAGASFATSSNCNSGALSNSPCCYANYNQVNGITVQDIFDFLADWFAGRPYAKVGGDGAAGPLTVQNIFDFLSNWFAGGCS